jgi:hypothetical protein
VFLQRGQFRLLDHSKVVTLQIVVRKVTTVDGFMPNFVPGSG